MLYRSTVRGASTGFGANITVVDDPQNPKQAGSQTELRLVQEWYSNTLATRSRNVNTDVKIIVQQRLHQEDLTGYLLNKSPNQFEHVCIPAELSRDVQPTELVKNYDLDGLYWGSYFNRQRLDELKEALGSIQYAGQFLQRPIPSEGGMFRYAWFKKMSLSDFTTICTRPVWNVFIDPAETDKKENDATGILIGCQFQNNFYVRESLAVRKEPYALEQWLNEYLPPYLSSSSRVYIEGKSSGKGLISNLKAKTRWNILEHQPGRDSKQVRAAAIQSTVEAGRVFLIDTGYVDDFLDEACTFPFAKHDDRVDSLVMLVSKKLAGKSSYYFN